jgi:hypothetical protein
MTAIARKVQIGTAACAIAVAAALTPAAVAQADPAVRVPTSSLGRSAGLISEAKRSPAANSSPGLISEAKRSPAANSSPGLISEAKRSPAANSSHSISASISASNSGPGTIFIFQNVGWFENVNFQIFINVQAGPYGTVSA